MGRRSVKRVGRELWLGYQHIGLKNKHEELEVALREPSDVQRSQAPRSWYRYIKLDC